MNRSYCSIHDTYPAITEPCWQCVNPLQAEIERLKEECDAAQADARALAEAYSRATHSTTPRAWSKLDIAFQEHGAKYVEAKNE